MRRSGGLASAAIQKTIPPAQRGPAGPKLTSASRRGLGDMVAAIAHPIAVAIDAIAGTHLKTCSACKKRQQTLNQMRL
jgi:hypothetical protein